VRAKSPPGVTAIALADGPEKGIQIGSARIGGQAHA
jgi:hypothetical protein